MHQKVYKAKTVPSCIFDKSDFLPQKFVSCIPSRPSRLTLSRTLTSLDKPCDVNSVSWEGFSQMGQHPVLLLI